MWHDIIIQLFFGFPSGVISLLLSVLGLVKRWPLALVIAAAWAVPATIYLSFASGLPLYLVSLLQLGGIIAMRRNQLFLAWALLLPLLFLTLYLAFFTLYAIFMTGG
jgi:hypothetical protein